MRINLHWPGAAELSPSTPWSFLPQAIRLEYNFGENIRLSLYRICYRILFTHFPGLYRLDFKFYAQGIPVKSATVPRCTMLGYRAWFVVLVWWIARNRETKVTVNRLGNDLHIVPKIKIQSNWTFLNLLLLQFLHNYMLYLSAHKYFHGLLER